MGARSGSNYLSSLKKLNAEIWLGGERSARSPRIRVSQLRALGRLAV